MKKYKKRYNNFNEVIADVKKGICVHYFNNNHFVSKTTICCWKFYVCKGSQILFPVTDGKIDLFYSLKKQ